MKLHTRILPQLLALIPFVTSCISNPMGLGTVDGELSSTSSESETLRYTISTVTITTGTSGSTKVFFDSATSDGPISDSCNVVDAQSGITSKPCSCRFSWDEMNTTTGTVIAIKRTVVTSAKAVQSNMLECSVPSVYESEIPDGSLIKISVIPVGTNTSDFSTTTYNYNKSTLVVSGSFQDAEGRAFDNILRYSCHDQFKRGLEIRSKKIKRQNSNSGDSVDVVMASQFCLSKAGSTQATEGCEGLRPAENSAQAYYYNLYIRNTDKGNINISNNRYQCPMVKEPLNSIGTVGSSNDFWPLDSTFALALTPSGDFPVGVDGYSKLGLDGDPNSLHSSCYGDGSTASDSSSLVRSCLGFAAKPSSDGSCPAFRDASGILRPTFRLRRYVAMYPPLFDTDGGMISEAQPTDTIYVLDRPVSSSGGDPLKPFTMLGPKPCPFAFFDHQQVVASPAGYVGTNDDDWTGKNVDGIELPNQDLAGASCSAALPILNADKSQWFLATVNSKNPVYQSVPIRPINAWAPHYVEDTDFEACAPQASPFRDAPLHFGKDSDNNVTWCAEAYPTQNSFINQIDPVDRVTNENSGDVIPYTSHTVKNTSSAACTASLPPIPSTYPTAENQRARHDLAGANATCDRTVQEPNESSWGKFPLLASEAEVEKLLGGGSGNAVGSDSSYGCTITFDNEGGKEGIASPSNGCCGATVSMTTGAGGNTSAHLEPGTACQTPTY